MTDEQSVIPESTPPVQADSGLSFKGLWQVLVSPGEFFEKLKDNPKIIIPWVVLGVLTLVIMYFIWEPVAQIQISETQKYVDRGMIPQSQVPQLEDLKWRTILLAPLGAIFLPLFPALLGLLIGNVFLGGKAKFKQILSVFIYGSWVFQLGALVKVPLILAKGSLAVGLSLGVLVADQGPASLAFVALDKFSLFHIWEFITVGIGMSALYGFSRTKGYVIAACSLFTWSLLHVASAWVQTLF